MDTNPNHIANLFSDIVHLIRNHKTSRKTKANFSEGELHTLAEVGLFLTRTKNKVDNLKFPDKIKSLLDFSIKRVELLLDELRAYDSVDRVDRTGIHIDMESRMRDITCSFYATRARLCIIDIRKPWGMLLGYDVELSWRHLEKGVEQLISEYDRAEVEALNGTNSISLRG